MSDPAPQTSPQAATLFRRKLPDERRAITHKFDIAGYEGYLTVGLYDNGMPGEIFLVMSKEGSTISGFADAFACSVSLSLQYGVPLQVLVDTFSHTRFEPSGKTKSADIPFAKSVVDYVFRWMSVKFLNSVPARLLEVKRPETIKPQINSPDAPPCTICGTIMTKITGGWKCSNCGDCTTES